MWQREKGCDYDMNVNQKGAKGVNSRDMLCYNDDDAVELC